MHLSGLIRPFETDLGDWMGLIVLTSGEGIISICSREQVLV